MNKSPNQTIEQLKKAYSLIAKDFSDSRSDPWPEFKTFVDFIPDESKILDLGCGNGRFYRYLVQEKRLTIDYTGIDFCPEFLSIAKDRYPNAEFIEENMTKFDIDRHFDRIVCIAAFHHIPSKALRKKSLRKIFDHLEDDGLFILSVWNLWQWKYWRYHVISFFSWIFSFMRGDPRGLMVPFGRNKVLRYYHAFFSFELRILLKQQGFKVNHFSISRHNFLFVCQKSLAKPTANPIPTSSLKERVTSSAVATCNSHP